MSAMQRTKKRARSLGYTLVEVLMSMTVLAVGAAGVVAMQKASVQGNQDARDLDEANAIAREWMDRLQRDATLWTPSDTGTGTNVPSALLIDEGINKNKGAWYFPSARLVPSASQNDYESPGFDPLARDLPSTAAQAEGTLGTTGLRYCVNVRLTQVVTDPLGGPGNMLRAEVRVYWPRMLLAAPDKNYCTSIPPDESLDTYHFVYVVSAVRMNISP